MTALNIRRVVIALSSLGFASVAAMCWIAPDQAARSFGLEAIDATGVASLRADLGGLFAGLAIVRAAAAWTQLRSWYIAAAALTGAIVTGRLLSWLANGPSNDAAALTIEVMVLASLLQAMRATATPQRNAASRR